MKETKTSKILNLFKQHRMISESFVCSKFDLESTSCKGIMSNLQKSNLIIKIEWPYYDISIKDYDTYRIYVYCGPKL